MDSPGAVQMKHVRKTSSSRAVWYERLLDQKHRVVTAGYGTFDASSTEANHYGMNSDYGTAEPSLDGSLVIAYMPCCGP